jgi:hypothetical protein
VTGSAVEVKPSVDLERRSAIVAKLIAMAASVPGQEGDGLANILEQLLQATSIDQLDTPWNSEGMKQYLGRPIMVNRIQKMDSTYKDGIAFYLLCFGVDMLTGEEVTFSTRAQAVIVQLLLVHTHKWFPRAFIPRESEEPTENGYYPQHLEVYRGPANPQAAGESIAERTRRIVAEREAAAPPPAGEAPRPRFKTQQSAPADLPDQPGF